MINKKELLAPVGGTKQLIAAVQNGADAVYLGGQRFNAREKADNFTKEELAWAIDYAHMREVKVYITINTLLKDQELIPALDYAGELYTMGADALILQDLGFSSLVKKHIPDLPMHMSTQGSIYNLSGVEVAEELGFSRVVLARELSLQQISQITQNTSCQIETFVHGALCMCYSGQCQLSRALGGRSGNRGLCAQPCRLPYENDQKMTSYWLSPKDICTVKHLGELHDAGITSLKIEGRMKSAEYVALVTGIYRKYLDRYEQYGEYTVCQEDWKTLNQIFNRGGFTTGYLLGNPGAELLSGELPKHQGVCIGKVVNKPSNQDLIDIETEEPIFIGDGVEIRSHTLTGNLVTYVESLKNGRTRIGDIKGNVRPGDKVYRITQSALMEKAKLTFCQNANTKKILVNLKASISLGKVPELTIIRGEQAVTVKGDVVTEKAINRPLGKEMVEKQLRKTGDTPFAIDNLEIFLEEGISLPISALNKLRRTGLDKFSENKLTRPLPVNLPKSVNPVKVNQKKTLAFYFHQGKKAKAYDYGRFMNHLGLKEAKVYLPIYDFLKGSVKKEGLQIIPYLSPITEDGQDEYIHKHFTEICRKTKETGISVGNLGWARKFIKAGVTVFTDYGLNIYNEQSIAQAQAVGMVFTSPSIEDNDQALGQIPLMITKHDLNTKTLLDRKKQAYKIMENQWQDKWMIVKKDEWESKAGLEEQWKKTTGELRIYIG
ncbi:MAG: U32 family peptidase [Anaerovoracaceae bacterium]